MGLGEDKMIAKGIVAGEDLCKGSVLYEKNGRGYCIRMGIEFPEEKWLGFAKDAVLKGENVIIVPDFMSIGRR